MFPRFLCDSTVVFVELYNETRSRYMAYPLYIEIRLIEQWVILRELRVAC